MSNERASVLIRSVAAPRNDLAFAEAIGLGDSISSVFLANAEKVGRCKAPVLVGGSDLGSGLAVSQIGYGHLGGFGVDCVGGDADHGADGERLKVAE